MSAGCLIGSWAIGMAGMVPSYMLLINNRIARGNYHIIRALVTSLLTVTLTTLSEVLTIIVQYDGIVYGMVEAYRTQGTEACSIATSCATNHPHAFNLTT